MRPRASRPPAGQSQSAHTAFPDWPGDSLLAEIGGKAIQTQVDFLAGHMQKQLLQHQAAMQNTCQVFEHLLQDLDLLCHHFRDAFLLRESADGLEANNEEQVRRIFCHIDPDRSVGILNILWHALSFTTRGNTKPLALNRPGRPPLFTGRIVALHGDFMDVHSNLQHQYFSEVLHQEIASLYVPADPSSPAVMQIRHLNNEEHYFHQVDAPRLFLLKTVEIVCGGGFFHES